MIIFYCVTFMELLLLYLVCQGLAFISDFSELYFQLFKIAYINIHTGEQENTMIFQNLKFSTFLKEYVILQTKFFTIF